MSRSFKAQLSLFSFSLSFQPSLSLLLSLIHSPQTHSLALSFPYLSSSNMSDEKKDEDPPPPPYTPYSGPGEASGTVQQSEGSSISGHQQQEECTTTTGSPSSLWRRMLGRTQVSSHESIPITPSMSSQTWISCKRPSTKMPPPKIPSSMTDRCWLAHHMPPPSAGTSTPSRWCPLAAD